MDLKLAQTLHKYALEFWFMNIQSIRNGRILHLNYFYLKQVVYFFVVDLQKWTKNIVLAWVFVNTSK